MGGAGGAGGAGRAGGVGGVGGAAAAATGAGAPKKKEGLQEAEVEDDDGGDGGDGDVGGGDEDRGRDGRAWICAHEREKAAGLAADSSALTSRLRPSHSRPLVVLPAMAAIAVGEMAWLPVLPLWAGDVDDAADSSVPLRAGGRQGYMDIAAACR